MSTVFCKEYTNYGVEARTLNLVKETPTQIHATWNDSNEVAYKFNKKTGREIGNKSKYREKVLIIEKEYNEIKNNKLLAKIRNLDNDVAKLKNQIDEIEAKKLELEKELIVID